VPKPLIPVDTGRPVQLVSVPELGVPSTGVTNVGDVPNTNAPEPVSPVTHVARFALDGVANHAATSVPRPLMPDETGNPLQFVNVPLAGVPRAGVTSVGDVAKTSAPLPVSFVTQAARFAEEGVASHVATSVPKPLMPDETGI